MGATWDAMVEPIQTAAIGLGPCHSAPLAEEAVGLSLKELRYRPLRLGAGTTHFDRDDGLRGEGPRTGSLDRTSFTTP
jgi:hypothetical protein